MDLHQAPLLKAIGDVQRGDDVAGFNNVVLHALLEDLAVFSVLVGRMVEHAVGSRNGNVEAAVPAARAEGGEDDIHAIILV